jgi:cytochrome P450
MTVTDWVSVEHSPPQWIPRDGALSVNRYADVATLLRHPDIRGPELGRNITKLAERANRSFPNLVNLVGGFLLFQNPPAHTRLRQFLRQTLELLGPALTEETIRGHADFLLDSVDADAPVDAIKALSNRLPIRVMAHALGVTEEFVVAARETNYGLHRVWHYGAPLRAFDRLEVEAGELLAPLIEKLRTGDGSAPGLQAIGALGKDQFDLAENEIAALVFFRSLPVQ